MNKTDTARLKSLQSLPRISVSEIRNDERLIRRLEDTALDIADKLTYAKANLDPNWWQFQDMLDDMHDMLDYVRKNLNNR